MGGIAGHRGRLRCDGPCAKGLHDMKTMILFPSRYFDLSKPETTFEAEYRAVLDTAGLDARLCNFDEFSEGSRLKLDEAVGEPVDFGELADGSWTVLETGDGQVSGLPTEIEPGEFYSASAKSLASEDGGRRP